MALMKTSCKITKKRMANSLGDYKEVAKVLVNLSSIPVSALLDTTTKPAVLPVHCL